MQAIMTPAPALVESAPSDWSRRFNEAQARYRNRNRKPAALNIEADPLPMFASPIDGVGNLDDIRFYETFAWSAELSARRLAAVTARHAANVAEMDASFADELVEATKGRIDARDDSDIPAPADDPAWDEVWTIPAEEVEKPKRPTPEELLKPITFYPLDHPARPTVEDYAYEAGFSLGESGYEPEQVAAPRHFTRGEVEAFAAGVAKGAEARWEEYGRWLEEQDRLGFLEYEPEEQELAEARMVRPVMA